jgi:isopenicillin N synthase-like dioxygenase
MGVPFMKRLPVIDVSPLQSANRSDWRPVIQAIDGACRNNGFMYVTGHGVPRSELDAAFDMAGRFFAQPTAFKAAVGVERWNWHRGWGGVGLEVLDPTRPGDNKETFDLSLDLPADHQLTARGLPVYGPNQYPDLPGFREVVDGYFASVMAAGLRILRAMALALDQPVDFFDKRFEATTSILRLIHYRPGAMRSQADQFGAGAHTDYGCITMLAQDDVGGLSVLDREGEWIDAPPIAGAYVVNIGDMMGRWTNDAYRSTLHRVTGDLSRDRYSIPFFMDPDYDTIVETLASCIPEGEARPYEPVIAGEWLVSRLTSTFQHHDKLAAGVE